MLRLFSLGGGIAAMDYPGATDDKITHLEGINIPSWNMYSGYLNVTGSESKVHYTFVESSLATGQPINEIGIISVLNIG